MHLGEIFLLLAGSLAVTAFARWRGWSAPLLVMGAAFVVSVIPGVPDIAVDGELVLSLVLPPLLYSAALDVTYLNFRFNAPTTGYATRQQERPLWQSIDVLLEGAVFALIGLQLPTAIADAAGSPIGLERTLLLAASVLVAVVLVRVVWVFGGYGFSRVVGRRVAAWAHAHGHRYRPEPRLGRRELFVIAWAGMRGVVTLATAAATPLASDSPATGTVFLIAFVVTVGTLLAQGLSLPALIRRLGVGNATEREQDRRDIRRVLARSAEAGAAYVEAQHDAWRERYGAETVDPIFERFTKRIRRDEQRLQELEDVDAESVERHDDFAGLMRDWIAARRRIVLEERDAGHLNEEVMRELMYALDAEELAFDSQTAVRADARGEA